MKNKETQRRNEERTKMQKVQGDKLAKKNYTYDSHGEILYIKRPTVELFPNDFNVSKISKKTLKKLTIDPNKDKETEDEIMQKYFSGKVVIVKDK